MNFYKIDAVCGAGKTTALIDYIKTKTLNNEFFLVTAETKVLVNQIHSNLLSVGVRATKIHQDSVNGSTTVALMEAMDRLDQVIVATKTSVDLMPFVPCSSKYHLIEDEIPSVYDGGELYLPTSYEQIKPLLKTKRHDWCALDVCELITTDLKSDVQKVIGSNDSARDSLGQALAKFYHQCKSDLWTVVTTIRNWDEFGLDKKLSYVALKTPQFYKQFKSVTIAGARFEYSILYKWWTHRYNVQWEDHSIIKNIEHRNNHSNLKNRVSIGYFDPMNSSKNKYKSITDDGITTIQHYCNIVANAFQDEYLVVANNEFDKIDLPKRAKRISVKSHGLNEYQHYTKIAFLPALNLPPAIQHILTAVGITSSMIKEALGVETAYQSVMRTALRDRSSNESVSIIVADRQTAESLAKIFGGATIIDHNGNSKTYTAHVDSRDDKKTHQRLMKIQKALCSFHSMVTYDENTSKIEEQIDVKPASLSLPSTSLDNTKVEISKLTPKQPIFKNRFSSDLDDESEVQYVEADHTAFRDFLASCSTTNRISDKSDNCLFSIGTYQFPSLPEVYQALTDMQFQDTGRRGKTNIKCAANLVLDFDNGEINREELTTLFKSYGYQFYICNSFSRKLIGNNTYSNHLRVIIPLSNFVIQETYTDIFMHFAKKLHQAGYNTLKNPTSKEFLFPIQPNEKLSGLDMSKIGMESMMYLPCTNTNEPDAAFFDMFFIKRPEKIFPVTQFIASTIKVTTPKITLLEVMEEVQEVKSKVVDNNSKLDNIDIITSNIIKGNGERNHALFVVVGRYKRCGLTADDVYNRIQQLNPMILDSKYNRNEINKMWEKANG